MNELPALSNKNLTKPIRDVNKAFSQDNLPQYLTKDQANAILAIIPQNKKRDYALLFLLWSTGVRITEAISLRKRDINFEYRTLTIYWLKKRRRMQRVIPLPQQLAYVLSVFTGSMNQDTLIFGISRQRGFQIVKRYGKKANLDREVHPHLFRHGYGVNWVKQKKPLAALQKLLGHSQITTTMIYVNLAAADVQEEVETLEL